MADPFIKMVDGLVGWLFLFWEPTPAPVMRGMTVYRTEDGGQTWRRLAIELTPEAEQVLARLQDPGSGFSYFGAIAIGDDRTALVSANLVRSDGLEPLLLLTQDGGNSWDIRQLNLPDWAGDRSADCGMLSALHMFPPDDIVGVAFCSVDRPVVFRSRDRGNSWEAIPWPNLAARPLHQSRLIAFLSPEVGWAFGSTIYKTIDGGQTWEGVKVVGWDYATVEFLDESLGWAEALEFDPECPQCAGDYALVRTIDGGRTWQALDAVLIGD
jgi:photosystem II stability/assembly factor-like uncharacterized protein